MAATLTPDTEPEAVEPGNRQNPVWTLLKILLALGLLGVVLAKVRPAEVAALGRQISLAWLPACLLVFLASTWAIARRYYTLIDREVAFPLVLKVVVLQTILGNLVASLAGFASYVALLKGRHQVGLGRGMLSLVAARFLDLVVWLPTLALAGMLLWSQVAPLHWLLVVLWGGMGGAVLIVLLVLVWRWKFLTLMDRALRLLRLDRFALVQKAAQALTALAAAEPARWRRLLCPLLGYSALTMLFSGGLFYCTLRLLGVPLSPWPIIFIFILTQLLMLIPIQVFGGLGVVDVSLLYLFGLFGLGEHAAAPVIIGGRLLLYGLTLLLFLYFPVANRWGAD